MPRMPKRAVSLTLDEANVLWLKGVDTATGISVRRLTT